MTHLITNAVTQTYIVIGVLLAGLLLTIRKRPLGALFPPEATTELKGLAILFVVLSHIGYFLVSDHEFLQPLSNFAGVGVDIFFILSGYGLVASALQRPISVWQFYRKRLLKIFVPVLVTMLLLLGLDYLVLDITYPTALTIKNLFGFFPQADLYREINSPLWYITPLLAYYILFPLVFWRKQPLISAGVLALAAWVFIYFLPDLNLVSESLVHMYKLHFMAFPVGMAVAALTSEPIHLSQKNRWVWTAITAVLVTYMLNNTQVGSSWKNESASSIVTALALVGLFMAKPINNKILALFGLFSFEIYLLHWPLVYRYDFLYGGGVPAGIATILYLLILLGLGYLMQNSIALALQSRAEKRRLA